MTPVIRTASPEDYDAIAAVVDDWWGRPIAGVLPRLFLDHFHPTSEIAEDDGGLAGFLIGFHSPGQDGVSYVHFAGVRPDRRGTGLARTLYERFDDRARAAGSTELRAVTGPVNTASVRFHERIGFTVTGPVPDHDGPGRAMITFRRPVAAPR